MIRNIPRHWSAREKALVLEGLALALAEGISAVLLLDGARRRLGARQAGIHDRLVAASRRRRGHL